MAGGIAAAALAALLVAQPASASFVAVGNDYGSVSDLTFSQDGRHWTRPLGDVKDVSGNEQSWGATGWGGLGIAFGGGNWVNAGAYVTTTSADGRNWTPTISDASAGSRAAAFGAGLWVLVGDTVYTSVDARSWTSRATPRLQLAGVAFGGGEWVAVGQLGILMVSLDGINWGEATSGTSNALNAVAYAGGQWVAVGSAGTVLTSSDGIVWVAQSLGTRDLYGVASDGTRWVAVGQDVLEVSSSLAATSWTPRMFAGELLGAAYAAGLWVVTGHPGLMYSSLDASRWVRHTSGDLAALASVAYGDGQWIAVGLPGWSAGFPLTSPGSRPGGAPALMLRSGDGENWTLGMNGAWGESAVASDGQRWVVAGASIISSEDGATWVPRTDASATAMLAVAFGDGWVAVGSEGTVRSSPDGLSWNETRSGVDLDLDAVAFGDGTWVAAGSKGVLLMSHDARTWVPVASRTAKALRGVAYGAGRWVAVGDSGTLLASTDGVSWTNQTLGAQSLRSVAFNGVQWALAGDAGTIATSPDGVSWTAAATGTTLPLYGIASDGSLWAAVSKYRGNTTVVTSPDGLVWTWGDKATESPLYAVGATTAPPLFCTPASQAVVAGSAATVTAHGGQGPYSWDAGDGADSAAGATFPVRYDAVGNHTVTLTTPGAPTQSAHCQVQVMPAPLACAPATQEVQPGIPVALTAQGGVSPYTWTWADGTPSAGPGIQFIPSGDLSVTLQDGSGASASCAVVVTAASGGNPPPSGPAFHGQEPGSPDAGAWGPTAPPSMPEPTSGTPRSDGLGQDTGGPSAHRTVADDTPAPDVAPLASLPFAIQVHESGQGVWSFSTNRDAGRFGWEFGDGSAVLPEARPTHAFAGSGTYLVRVVFIAGDGRLETAMQEVTVRRPAHEEGAAAAPRLAAATPEGPWGAWIAVGAAALVAGGVLLRYGWPHFLLVFFSRLRRSDVERHPMRSRIIDVLAEHPGMHEKGLADLLGKERKTVSYHLRVLRAAGLAHCVRWEGLAGWWLKANEPPRGQGRTAALRSGNARAVVSIVSAQPDIGYMDLLRRSGLRESTLRYHLDRLQRAGFVGARREGRQLRLFAVGGASTAVA